MSLRRGISIDDAIEQTRVTLGAIEAEEVDLAQDVAEAKLRTCLKSVRDICGCQATYIGLVTKILTETISLVGSGTTTSLCEEDLNEYATY